VTRGRPGAGPGASPDPGVIGAIDVKAADARALLRRLAREPLPERAPASWRMSRTWFWDRFAELAEAIEPGP
jgi:hypothetical protein